MDNRTIISLFDPKLHHTENVEKAFTHICNNFSIKEDMKSRLREKLYNLECKFIKKWIEAKRTKERFFERNLVWLEAKLDMREFIVDENMASCSSSSSSSSSKRGRPAKPFSQLSDRSKRRHVDSETLNPKTDSVEKALLLARRTAYSKNEVNVVKVIGHLLKNLDHFSSIHTKLKDNRELKTPEEALGFIIELGFSKFQYEALHFDTPSRYPPYDVIKKAKKSVLLLTTLLNNQDQRLKLNCRLSWSIQPKELLKLLKIK